MINLDKFIRQTGDIPSHTNVETDVGETGGKVSMRVVSLGWAEQSWCLVSLRTHVPMLGTEDPYSLNTNRYSYCRKDAPSSLIPPSPIFFFQYFLLIPDKGTPDEH